MLVSSDVRWEHAKFFAVSRAPSPPPFTYGAPSPRERRCWGLGCYLITCGATLCTSSMSRPPHTALVLRHISSESLANVRSARVFSFGFWGPVSSTAVHCRPAPSTALPVPCNAVSHHHGAAAGFHHCLASMSFTSCHTLISDGTQATVHFLVGGRKDASPCAARIFHV